MRRERIEIKHCEHSGCMETARYRYSSLREMRESSSYGKPWRCTRHYKPDEVLTPQNLKREAILTASKSIKYPNLKELFWHAEGSTLGSGFISGPGFKAFTEDFPEGTRIRISAEILLPELKGGAGE